MRPGAFLLTVLLQLSNRQSLHKIKETLILLYSCTQKQNHKNTHKTTYSPKSLKKALLILVQYPVLGALLLQQTLLVLLLVGFLEAPSEDEYPELSTPL